MPLKLLGEAVCRSPQGAIIYEEPSSSGRMHLDKDGGAVLLTNPDGSTQLVLLTSDQQQQVAAAQSWKLPPPETPTYTVRICPTSGWSPPSVVLSIAQKYSSMEFFSLNICLARTRLGNLRAWPCEKRWGISGRVSVKQPYTVHHPLSE